MQKKHDQPAPDDARRRAAQTRLDREPPTKPPQTNASQQQLPRELNIPPIELEMQNEELRTSRAQIEAGLERFSELFDFAPAGYFEFTTDAIWLLDKEQRVLRSNKMADQLFPRPHGQKVGQRCWETMHGVNQPIPGCPVERARRSLQREYLELLIGDRWYRVTGDPILDPAGQFAGAIQIVHDITERKRLAAEQEGLEAQNRLLQKSESLARMAAAVAHNFNNQLQVVILNLELALTDLPPNTSPGINLSEAMKSALKAAAISNQMLAYLGQTPVQFEPLDLSAVCRRGLSLFQTAFPEAVVETELPAPGPVITCR